MTYTLKIDELHFDAGHYLNANFGKCQNDHGHRYYVRNLVVITDRIVDFGWIKKAVDKFDHCKIIPKEHTDFWRRVQKMAVRENMPFKIKVVPIPHNLTVVENIKEEVKKELLKVNGVKSVTFELYETPNYGVVVE